MEGADAHAEVNYGAGVHGVSRDHASSANARDATKRPTGLARDYPRLYNIATKVVGPLLFLILLSYLCGFLLADAEAQGEKDANDAAYAGAYTEYANALMLSEGGFNAADKCIDLVNLTQTNTTKVRVDFRACMARPAITDAQNELLAKVNGTVDRGSTFDWIRCSPGGDPRQGVAKPTQLSHTWAQWQASYAATGALDNATGMGNCHINTAGGSMFWFTVMTTMGYGHTAPKTPQGRALVYVLGVLSIFLFTAVIGQAGCICLAVCDDFLERMGARRLTKGWPATIMWLACFTIWLLAIAGIAKRWHEQRKPGGENVETHYTFEDAIWFAFISASTIGFGDYYIPHEVFLLEDMFYIPLVFLVAFVLLANFFMKLSEVIMALVPEGESLEDTLARTRQPRARDPVALEDASGSKIRPLGSVTTHVIQRVATVSEL